MERPRRSDGTTGQMDAEAGWWTTSGKIGLARVKRGVDINNNVMLHMLVRYVSPRGPMCFRCLMFNLSGSVHRCFWGGLSVMLCDCSVCIDMSMDPFVLCTVCLIVFVEWVLLLLQFMCWMRLCCCFCMSFCCWRDYVLSSIVCVLCLLSQCAFRCSLHIFCSCVYMPEVFSAFCFSDVVSVYFCCDVFR